MDSIATYRQCLATRRGSTVLTPKPYGAGTSQLLPHPSLGFTRFSHYIFLLSFPFSPFPLFHSHLLNVCTLVSVCESVRVLHRSPSWPLFAFWLASLSYSSAWGDVDGALSSTISASSRYIWRLDLVQSTCRYGRHGIHRIRKLETQAGHCPTHQPSRSSSMIDSMEWKCPLCPTLAFLSYACAIFRTRPPQESFKSTGGRTRELTLYLRGYRSPQEVQDCACVSVPELCLLGYVLNDTAVDYRDDQRSGGVCGEGFSIEARRISSGVRYHVNDKDNLRCQSFLSQPMGRSTLASGMPKLEASQSRKCPSGICRVWLSARKRHFWLQVCIDGLEGQLGVVRGSHEVENV